MIAANRQHRHLQFALGDELLIVDSVLREGGRTPQSLSTHRYRHQGGWRRQRGPEMLDRPNDVRGEPPVVFAIQGSGKLGARSLRREKHIPPSRAARRDGTTPHAAGF
jgi:hypothetical protein